jgi:hypothetical protein
MFVFLFKASVVIVVAAVLIMIVFAVVVSGIVGAFKGIFETTEEGEKKE